MVKPEQKEFSKTGSIVLGTMPKSKLKLPPLKLATDETFGERFARLRKERGLTQAALAKKVGITQSIVADYESTRLRMHPEMVIRISNALEVTTDELLGKVSNRAVSGRLSLKVVRRLSRIESLPDHQQRALLQTIDAFLKASDI